MPADALRLLLCGLLLLTAADSSAVVPANELRQALQLRPDLRHGRTLYETCASCHQPNGAGQAESAIPGIAGQHYEFIVSQLADFRDGERWDARMAQFTAPHQLTGPQDLADVAAYVAGLPRQTTAAFGNGKSLQAGARIYGGACESCHGANGEGNAGLRHPWIGGQHYSYLLRELDTIGKGLRPNVAWDHRMQLSSYSSEELAGVADYISRLAPGRMPKSTDSAH